MPEPTIHFSVVFALSAPRLGVKRALILSAVALLPDLDILLYIHRSMSHSIIVLGLLWLPILLAIYVFKRRFINLGIICFLAVLSHLLMDCFQTYTPILYPVLDMSIWVAVNGRILISSGDFKPQSSVSVKGVPTTFRSIESIDAPLFTSEGFIISLLLTVIPLLLSFKWTSRFTNVGGVKNIVDPPEFSSGGVKPAAEADEPGGVIAKDMVTVVIPTLNEEEGIGLVIDGLLAEGYKNILVVDGYSTDRTVEIARSKGVKVVYQEGSGKAGAILTAIGIVSTPYILVMDGDCTYDPKDIERLLRHAGDSDEVVGYRSNRGNIPLLHRIGNRIISLAFSLMLGKRIRDPCSGIYLLRTNMARRLEITSAGFDVEVEIAGQIASLGKIREVPVSYRRRVGRGKLRAWRDGLRILMASVKIMWLYNPVFMLSVLVALLAAPGAAILIWQLTLRYLYGSEAWSLGWSWFGLILFVAGLQGLAVAVMSLMLKRMERRIIQVLKEGKSG